MLIAKNKIIFFDNDDQFIDYCLKKTPSFYTSDKVDVFGRKMLDTSNQTYMSSSLGSNDLVLNNYMNVYASLNMDETKGILYLDTITDENILFTKYEEVVEEPVETEEIHEKPEE